VYGLFNFGYTYGFHLFHVITENDILSRAIQSVTKNGQSLIMVAALMISIIYIYSVALFIFARKSFERDDGMFCDNLGRCFLTSLSNGLRAGMYGVHGAGFPGGCMNL
jgi:hypothetical protein